MLERQIERVRRAKFGSNLVLATSVNPEDDAIAELGNRCGVTVFRGSLDDVLDRFYHAAKISEPSHVVRLTGDCPLTDPCIIDAVTNFAVEGDFDYASNTIKPTFPDGLDVEVAKFSALAIAWHEAKPGSDREHVMPFLHRQPDRFKLGSFEGNTDLSHMRWTVDDARDFDMVNAVYEALYPSNPSFRTSDIISFLADSPEVRALNSDGIRNQGYAISLAQDANKNG